MFLTKRTKIFERHCVFSAITILLTTLFAGPLCFGENQNAKFLTTSALIIVNEILSRELGKNFDWV